MSGVTNAGEAFDFVATLPAEESTYSGIIRMVESAQQSKAPMSRIADKYALAFLAVAVLMAGIAWIWAGDPVRALAVLVIATPCPLILAVPVAIISGVSRAAKAGVLVKGGAALEALAAVTVAVIDKTGTLTGGRARVISVNAVAGYKGEDIVAPRRRWIRPPNTASPRPLCSTRLSSISSFPSRHKCAKLPVKEWKASSKDGILLSAEGDLLQKGRRRQRKTSGLPMSFRLERL